MSRVCNSRLICLGPKTCNAHVPLFMYRNSLNSNKVRHVMVYPTRVCARKICYKKVQQGKQQVGSLHYDAVRKATTPSNETCEKLKVDTEHRDQYFSGLVRATKNLGWKTPRERAKAVEDALSAAKQIHSSFYTVKEQLEYERSLQEAYRIFLIMCTGPEAQRALLDKIEEIGTVPWVPVFNEHLACLKVWNSNDRVQDVLNELESKKMKTNHKTRKIIAWDGPELDYQRLRYFQRYLGLGSYGTETAWKLLDRLESLGVAHLAHYRIMMQAALLTEDKRALLHRGIHKSKGGVQSLAEALAGADAVPYSDLSANTAVAGMYNAVITQQIFESNVQGALDTMQEALSLGMDRQTIWKVRANAKSLIPKFDIRKVQSEFDIVKHKAELWRCREKLSKRWLQNYGEPGYTASWRMFDIMVSRNSTILPHASRYMRGLLWSAVSYDHQREVLNRVQGWEVNPSLWAALLDRNAIEDDKECMKQLLKIIPSNIAQHTEIVQACNRSEEELTAMRKALITAMSQWGKSISPFSLLVTTFIGPRGWESAFRLYDLLRSRGVAHESLLEHFLLLCEEQQNFEGVERLHSTELSQEFANRRNLFRGMHAMTTIMLFASIPPAALWF
eukprot:m.264891 g.264891  ORF g.264891 m.264891 type:complete len:618 (+) comp16233_c0_seq33:146-1999(+)